MCCWFESANLLIFSMAFSPMKQKKRLDLHFISQDAHNSIMNLNLANQINAGSQSFVSFFPARGTNLIAMFGYKLCGLKFS